MEHLKDGLALIREDLPVLTAIVAKSARWIHPDVFRALPVWYPEKARGQQTYDVTWTRPLSITNRTTGKVVANVEKNDAAIRTMRKALGVTEASHWAVCHIWGHDDPRFASSNRIVKDPRFYTCPANLVWLPAPLKGLTDIVPEIKTMLRFCSRELYGWVCEHEDARGEADRIRAMTAAPEGYPASWPRPGAEGLLPPNTIEPAPGIMASVEARKAHLKAWLDRDEAGHFPKEQVLHTLGFWNVDIGLEAAPGMQL